jgi:lipopolysaccharide/colanic/teichoic acid biosynthesis glycosyltransferase
MAFTPARVLPAALPGRSRLPQVARPWYALRREPFLDTASYELVKRAIDIVASAVALPFVLTLLAVLALAVRLDSPGAAFFSQPRTGRGGKRFRMFKLRTMVRNAEELKQKYMHLNELQYPDFKIANDPRMTRVGRFLRKTSLDELPQVLNVLRGDMTLVGPRPTSFSSDTYRLWHTARLQLKPGMTGLWQVSGRNELDFDDRVRLDVAYIRNRCLWLDIQILLRTGLCVFNGRGAN